MANLKLTLRAALAVIAVFVFSSCGGRNESASKDIQANGESVVAAGKQAAVDEVLGDLPTVIDFYADWCGPCRQISPLFDELMISYQGQLNFRRVNVDENSQLAEQYHITSIPAFVFLDRNGKEVKRIVGADAESLKAEVAKMANNQ